MCHKVVKTEEFINSILINLETDPILTAGDVVRLLLEKGIDSQVSWNDYGDVGMKAGGFSKGSDFFYPEMLCPWGGCSYDISFTYENVSVSISAYDDENNKPNKTITISCPMEYDYQRIIELLK